MEQKRIMVINGPNLNLLGKREPEVYGSTTLAELRQQLERLARELSVNLNFVTSNHEGELVEAVQHAAGFLPGPEDAERHATRRLSGTNATAGLVINPAAFSHYSIALRDALELCSFPVVEVHLSNIFAREAFRSRSVISPVVNGVISGLGPLGYLLALRAVVSMVTDRDPNPR